MASALPTGTVTFLLTDIEGSTRLVQDLPPDTWLRILEEHNDLIRQAVADNGGLVVKTEGDAFFAIFESAPSAVAAAATMQAALQSHPWPPGGRIKVRVGVHTGDGNLGGDDYVGLDVHRAARIAAAGHGNQVVLSETTAALSERQLPSGASLRDLGKHRLKDLSEPEALFELVLEGLASEFPLLRTLDDVPNNLPLIVTSFVGRREELEEIESLLDENPLVTLTGPGGTGKTRLALQTGAELGAQFTDGVFFVDLAPVSEPGILASVILASLGLEAAHQQDPPATLLTALRTRHVLMVLDNFEQILSARPLVAEMVRASPRSRFLVTSRAPLRLASERELPISPMPVPSIDADLETLAQADAVRLFVERAIAVRPDFTLDVSNAAAVADLVTMLDGLPLAIELVASRLRLLPVPAILERLDTAMLAGGAVDLPERQRTIEGAIAWSYDLLAEAEKCLFARLAVFAGGARLEEIEKVCGPNLEIHVLDGLETLVDQSLLRTVEASGDSRFRMLHVIREFAEDRLVERAEGDDVSRRHLHAYIDLAEQATDELKGARRSEWLDRLARDHDNIRAALEWALARNEVDLGRRLTFATWRFWQARGHLHEGRRRTEELLAAPGGDPYWRAKALEGLGGILWWAGGDKALATYTEALAIHRTLGDKSELANALYNHALAQVFSDDARVATATVELDEAERLYQELGDTSGLGDVEWGRGNVFGIGTGDLERGSRHWERGLDLYRQAGNVFGAGWALFELALSYLESGDSEMAWKYLKEGLEIFAAHQDVSAAVLFIAHIGRLANDLGDDKRAIRLGGALQALRLTSGADIVTHNANRVEELTLERLEALTGELAEAYQAGRRMSFSDALAYALAGPVDER